MTSANVTPEFSGKEINSSARTFFVAAGTVMVLSGLLGNILVLGNLLSPRMQAMCSVHNMLLLNMSMADLLITGYWLPFLVLDLYLGHMPVAGFAHCVINGVLDVWLEVVSSASLAYGHV